MIYHGEDLGDYYLVSNTGEIKGVKTGKIRKKNVNHQGYYFVGISLGSCKKFMCIKNHRAVAETFIPKIDGKEIINHRDGNKLNNLTENLEWVTYRENNIHALKTGLKISKRGTHSPFARFNDEQIEYIRNRYAPRDKKFGSRPLARKFDVSHNTILRIVNYETYPDQ